jgi:uridylate kinase
MSELTYKRILLKLSGEAFMGDSAGGIDGNTVLRLAEEVKQLCDIGVQVGLVIGGGNILRGSEVASDVMNRVTSDHTTRKKKLNKAKIRRQIQNRKRNNNNGKQQRKQC